MPYVKTPPPPPPPPAEREYGDGDADDGSDSTYRATVREVAGGNVEIIPITGMTGTQTLTDPSRVRARLQACHVLAADGAGISGVDLNNGAGTTKFVHNKATGTASIVAGAVTHAQNLDMVEGLCDALVSMGR